VAVLPLEELTQLVVSWEMTLSEFCELMKDSTKVEVQDAMLNLFMLRTEQEQEQEDEAVAKVINICSGMLQNLQSIALVWEHEMWVQNLPNHRITAVLLSRFTE
jgi:hypothetical protein